MDELKTCPFCGNKGRLNTWKDEALSSHNIVDWYGVGCSGCEVSTERSEDKDEAIDNWNTRFDGDHKQELIEETQ